MIQPTTVIGLLLGLIMSAGMAQTTNTFPTTGNVGIGTTSPGTPLEVKGTVKADQYGGGTSSAFIAASNGPGYAWYVSDQATDQKEWDIVGVGTALFFRTVNDANSNANFWMQVNRGSGFTISSVTFPSGNVGIGTTNPSAPLEVDGNVKLTSGSGASITFQDGTTQSTAYTGVTCGGDYAESVDVTGDRARYLPGDVLVLDPRAPGKVLKVNQPYSTLVAGIYSTKPGTVGRRQLGPKNPDEVPMAMMGIVPTNVTAENGPIQIGDLLVASSTLGRAMKGTDHNRMFGAVIGKAMGPLDSGTGVIEVLVTLQ